MSILPRTTPNTSLGKIPNLSDSLSRMTDFSFLGTFNMGYEGFSKSLALLCVIAGGTQCKTSVSASLTKQLLMN